MQSSYCKGPVVEAAWLTDRDKLRVEISKSGQRSDWKAEQVGSKGSRSQNIIYLIASSIFPTLLTVSP